MSLGASGPAPGSGSPPPLLEMRGIEKSFPGVKALRGIDLRLAKGEVLALLGENGAGKSTLMKVLGGIHRADAGEIHIEGARCEFSSPAESQRAGVALIHQELNLVPALTARENIFLGQERTRFGFLRRRDERRRAEELFERIGVRVDPEAPCRSLSVARQQVVEIAKALLLEARILVMDEPSATLTLTEVEKLFGVITELRSQGIGIVYISHRLDEIFTICDRISVLRDGRSVGERVTESVTRDELIELMVGRKLEHEFPPPEPSSAAERLGEVRLEVRGLARGDRVRGVGFSARRGEILALTGLVGAGRTETARLIFGADRRESGSILLDGEALSIEKPGDAIRHGIGLLSEDRKAEGLVLRRSVLENFGLANLARHSRAGFVRRRSERDAFLRHVEGLRIKIPHANELARNLSGGNQQKVVLAKWLERDCAVLLFDEPTRGIDVGAKLEIYRLMRRLARDGKTIVMISSELPEVLGMADRILVLHEGELRGEIRDVASATQAEILQLAVGSGERSPGSAEGTRNP